MEHTSPTSDVSQPKKKSRRTFRTRSRSKKSLTTTGSDTFYYGIYSEFTQYSRVYPCLFKLPSQALCYQLSRYMKDGHVQSWQSWLPTADPPNYVNMLGTVVLAEDEWCESVLGKAGEREGDYFNSIQFYEYNPPDPSKVITSGYVTVQKELFNACISTLKSIPDYYSSANSIYKSVCCTYLDHAIIHTHNPAMHRAIDNHGFICLGSTLRRSKLTESYDEGECKCILFHYKCT